MRLFKTLIALQIAALALLSMPADAASPLPQGEEIKVSVNKLAWHYNPSVAVFPDGGFVVVFTAGPRADQPGRRVIHARLFDSQGKPTGGQFRLIDRVAGSQYVDQVVADRDGSFLVVWTENTQPNSPYSVFVRRFRRDGTPRGPRIRVTRTSRSSRSGGVLAIGPDGRFAVAWKAYVPVSADGEGYFSARARIFNAQGKPVTGERSVLEGFYGIGDDTIHVTPYDLTLGPGGALDVLVQSYDVTGILTTELVRSSPAEIIPLNPGFNCCPSDYDGASLVLSRDGGLMATWGEDQIVAQRFTRRGDAANRFIVSQEYTEAQIYPALAQHADGSFVVVWMEWDRDGDAYGLFGRAFTSTGVPLTGDFRVNATTAGHQQSPAIAASRQGPVVVVWEQIAKDGRANIFARILK